jgi:hypothetical protein
MLQHKNSKFYLRMRQAMNKLSSHYHFPSITTEVYTLDAKLAEDNFNSTSRFKSSE